MCSGLPNVAEPLFSIPVAIGAKARTYLRADMIEVLGRFEEVTRRGRA